MFVETLNDDDRIDRDTRCLKAFDSIWEALKAGATSGNPFNFLQLATVNQHGRPEVRTIVLRQVDRNDAALYFITDFRSPKMADIDHNYNIALVGYDPARRVQIRLTGSAKTEGDPEKRADQWGRLSERTRDGFHSPVSPGARLHPDGKVLSDIDKNQMSPFERYCLMRVDIASLEYLDISQAEHVRFCFERSEQCWLGARREP